MQESHQKSMFERLHYLENQLRQFEQENSLLTKENSQLRTFLKIIPQMISFVDKDLVYRYVNAAYERFFHFKAADILGKRVPDLIGQNAFNDIKVHIEKALSGKEVKYLLKMDWFSGIKYVEGHLVPEFNADRGVTGYYAIHSDVTHHFENLEKLRESESRQRYFAAHAQDLMWSCDLDLNVTFINHYSKKLLGWEPQELMKLNLDQMFPFNTLIQVLPYYRQKLKEVKSGNKLDSPINLEVELLHKNGGTVWVEIKADFTYDDKGKPVGINGITRNIEARKKAEIKLKEKEALYRLLLKNTTDAVYLTDEKGIFKYVAPGRDVIFGYEQEEILQKESICNLFSDDFSLLLRQIDDRESINIRKDIFDREGRAKKLLLNIKKVDIKNGKLLFSCRDITDLEETRIALNTQQNQFYELEQQRRQQQRLLQHAEELAKWGSWEWDIQADKFILSRGWRKIHNYFDDNIRFADLEKIIHPEDLPKIKTAVDNALLSGGMGEVEVRITPPGTEIRYVKSTGKVFLDESGVPIKMIGYVRDITDQKQTEKQLLEKLAHYKKIMEEMQGHNPQYAASFYMNEKTVLIGALKKALHELGSQFNIADQHFEKIWKILDNNENQKKDKTLIDGQIDEMHKDFFAKMVKEFPRLTQYDLRHCAYIKLNLSTREIARLFGIQPGSVQKSRVRLKKKLGLDQDEALRSFLHKF